MSQIAESTVLAPFEIWEVPLDDRRTIKFNEPLIVQPEILPPEEPGDRTYLIIDMPKLNISVHAEDRDDLWEVLFFDIQFIWEHIVLNSKDALSQKAMIIKKNWLAIAEVVDG